MLLNYCRALGNAVFTLRLGITCGCPFWWRRFYVCLFVLVFALPVWLKAGTYALVADGGNKRVAEFYVTGTTWNFVGNFVDNSTMMANANGALAALAAPNSVVQDQQGRIYVSDWNGAGSNRILRFNTNGVFLDMVGTNGLNGFNVLGNGVDDMALGPDGNIYATLAFGTANNQILKFNVAATTWSVFYSNSATLNIPRGLAFSPDGNLYVNSRGNAQMLVFDLNGNLLRTNATFSGLFTTTPMGLRWDGNGNHFICTAGNGGSVICTCTTNGVLTMITGQNPTGGPGSGVSTLGALALGTNVFCAPYKSSSRVYLCSNNATNLVTTVDSGTSPLLSSANYMNFISGWAVSANSFNTYGDGFWRIINQGNSGSLVVGSSGATQATGSTSVEAQQFEMLLNLADGSYRLRAHDSWLGIGAQNGSTSVGTAVVTISSYTGAASQKWNLVGVGGGYFRIINVSSGLALQTDNGSPANVTLQPVADNSSQYWSFSYQTHYPKKGMAGWDSQMSRFNASWLYNWGWSTGQGLSSSQVFNPMLWGNWGPGGVSTTEKPQCAMGFNEPDHTDQANMTTDQAIARWPQLLALNVPLVSPAPANLFGGWLADFYSKTTNNGYRVDFTGVHAYPSSTSASSLISTLQSGYNTWGRPIWLTEFSVVDWAGTHTWSEQDNYKFLAEFMWRAEDLTWFKRYSLFLFSGTPSTNPWDGDGHRSDTFMPDNYTFTPFGELYAAWDADRTLRSQTPYFVLNKATCFRLTSTRSVGSPQAFSIRNEDAGTQWVLTNAPNGSYYIQSLADGRRLAYTNNTLALAASITTGATVEWTFDGPDSSGYYFINNPNGNISLSGSGTAPAISFTAVVTGSPSDNTRWRFVKPYYPVSLAAVTAPTSLVAKAANRSVMLSWNGVAPRYNVYRSTTAGGPYTCIASDVKWNSFADNTALNGGTYYYVISSVNGLEIESTYSSEISASPASGLGLGLVAEYKFENSMRDTSGNALHGTLSGTTSFGAGRIDATCLTLTGGDVSYGEIPNLLGNDFSIAFWVKTTSTAATGQWWNGDGLVDGEVGGVMNDFGVSLVGTKVGFGVGGPDVTITSTSAINDGQWHHIVATRNGTTGGLQLYVDGNLQATGAGSALTRTAPVSLRLGCLQSGYNNFAGSLDEVRLYNYVLTTNEISTLANQGSMLVARYQFEGNAMDSSGFGNDGTTNGNISYVAGKVDSLAAQFDGSSSYVQIPVAAVGDFSIAYWMKTTATAGTGQWWAGKGIVDGEVGGSTADFGTSLLGNKVAFGVGNPDTTITSTTIVNDGQWHHVVVTRATVSGAMKLYVDGNLQATGTGATGARTGPTALRIGGIQAGGGFFVGALDDVRIYNYVINASQVSALYAPQPLPSPWQNTDIGSPDTLGYANYASGVWTMGGGGTDVWNTADQFQFVYQPFTNSATIAAIFSSGAIVSDGTTNTHAKAGVMFRDSLAANAPFVALVHDQGLGLQLLYRDSIGASAGQQGASIAINPPVWLRLVRTGNTFNAYYTTTSPTLGNWILIGSHSTVIADSALAGMVICAHDNFDLVTAICNGVTVVPPTPPTISILADRSTSENISTPQIAFSVNDAQVPSSNIVLSSFSSNTGLVPNGNIVLSGSGASRNIRVTPATSQAGSATIFVLANNGQPTTNVATNSFLLTVTTTSAGYWRQQWFGTTANTGIAADTACPVGDGVLNVTKRFFNLNPWVVASASDLPLGALAGTNFAMTYTHSLLATDLLFQTGWSSNLLNWNTNLVIDAAVSTNGTTEMRASTMPANIFNQLFLRLQVIAP
jgi:hypothetical protein